jgi:hypothetical protein
MIKFAIANSFDPADWIAVKRAFTHNRSGGGTASLPLIDVR